MNTVKEKVKITFLGGVGEIGKNMTAFEYKDSEYSKTTGRVIKMIYQVDFN